MAILLILGIPAGLFMLAMLFTLAIYALPLYAGMSVGFWARTAGYGVLGAFVIGFLAAVLTWVVGQVLFATVRTAMARFAIALLFAVPAAFAGYHAVHGVAGLAFAPGLLRGALSCVGAVVIGAAAWTRLPVRLPRSTARDQFKPISGALGLPESRARSG